MKADSPRPSMASEDVGERLCRASELRDERRRRERAAMDPESVGRRLRKVSELRDLCLLLGGARGHRP